MKQCKYCNKIIKGRIDKKFCSKICSNKYHAEKRRERIPKTVRNINAFLIKNRAILKEIMEESNKTKLKVDKLVLAQQGFNFHYCTGVYFNRQGKMYHYIYEYAWMEFSDQVVLIVKK